MSPVTGQGTARFALGIDCRGRARIVEDSAFRPAGALRSRERCDTGGFGHAFQAVATGWQAKKSTRPTKRHPHQLRVETNRGIGAKFDRKSLERLVLAGNAAGKE